MTDVYVVMCEVDYEGGYLIGVYSSLKKARKAILEYVLEETRDEFYPEDTLVRVQNWFDESPENSFELFEHGECYSIYKEDIQ